MFRKVLLILGSIAVAGLPSQAKLVEQDPDGSTRVNAPFVHVNVDKSDPYNHTVKVRAPFAKVDKPPGYGNTQVRAPFTKVQNPPGYGNARVTAPFTKVQEHPATGQTTVRAPFTKVQAEPRAAVPTSTYPNNTYRTNSGPADYYRASQ